MSKEALRGEIAALRETVEALRSEVATLRLETVAHHCQSVIYQPYQVPGAAGGALPLIFPNTCAQPPLYMQSIANTGCPAPPPSTYTIALAGNAN